MEKELNIAAILKEKPLYTKLWSPICGECKLHLIKMSNPEPIEVAHGNNGGIITLSKDGKYFLEGESILFPSKEMRSWEKFAWKKGDVLCSKAGDSCIFVKWISADYTSFLGYYSTHKNYENEECQTAIWNKIANKEDIEQYILAIEAVKNGTLNLETLAIEQPKQEFKDGDILVAEKDSFYDKVIFIASIKSDISSKALIDVDNEDYEVDFADYRYGHNRTIRLATDSEKQQLFDALAKKGKVWNSETKQIEDLPKKCELKAFDFVLVNDKGKDSLWFMYQFAFEFNKKGYKYYCMIGGRILEANLYNILPYNDSTKHLLGTTDEWKGDEV